jgi:hypothetical protein
MTEALLGRIARHGVSQTLNPREDRLTEVCAAVLQSQPCDGLARHIARGWIESAAARASSPDGRRFLEISNLLSDVSLPWTTRIRTQLPIRTARGWRRPDLELLFEQHVETVRRQVLVWVEIKHGTAPHDHQLHEYVKAQPRRGIHHAVVLLLAPRIDYTWFDEAEIPASVPWLTWEETARILADFEPADAVGAFLIDELKTYWREEGLVDPDELTQAHIEAFANYKAGLQALQRICELSAKEIGGLWATGEPGTWPKQGPVRSYWWSYPHRANDGTTVAISDDWDLHWQLQTDAADELVSGRPGSPALIAGLGAERGTLGTINPLMLEKLNDAGIEAIPAPLGSRTWDYLARVAYPEDIPTMLGGDNLTDQAHGLTGWIDRTFREIATILRGS